jgi:hypothetical protein
VVLLISALADPRRRFFQAGRELVPAPTRASYVSKTELARAGIFPSTVGVSLLCAAALAFDRTLGALLAGALAGMGLAALVGGARIAELERRERVRLFAERGGRRLYTQPVRGENRDA